MPSSARSPASPQKPLVCAGLGQQAPRPPLSCPAPGQPSGWGPCVCAVFAGAVCGPRFCPNEKRLVSVASQGPGSTSAVLPPPPPGGLPLPDPQPPWPSPTVRTLRGSQAASSLAQAPPLRARPGPGSPPPHTVWPLPGAPSPPRRTLGPPRAPVGSPSPCARWAFSWDSHNHTFPLFTALLTCSSVKHLLL